VKPRAARVAAPSPEAEYPMSANLTARVARPASSAVRRVVFDHQIFTLQQFGGVSRYFCELATRLHGLPGWAACVAGGLHLNTHLAEARVPHLAVHLGMQLPLRARICGAVNRLVSPWLEYGARPSLLHRTYYGLSDRRRMGAVPVVVTVFDMIHELAAAGFRADDTTARDKRLAVRNADHVLCISHSTANDLVRLLDVPREKVSVTHLGYSAVFRQQAASARESPPPRPYLLYVGQRGGYKNFATALAAYADSPMLREGFDLVAFGGPPFSADELSAISALALRPDRVVRRTGPDQELAIAYRHASALIYPSRYEGFGIPPLEAMACGCPVVSANTSSLPEVVGTAALLFDPSDQDALRRAMETAVADGALRARLVADGLRQVQHFSWDRCARETAAVYRSLLGGGQG
jgi:glycosyltransferase involved in cell wall biosynthesis